MTLPSTILHGDCLAVMRSGGDRPAVRARVDHAFCRLVTPPGGTVLDPFLGSGSTGRAAALEDLGFVGIEREAEYVAIARRRIAAAQHEARSPVMRSTTARKRRAIRDARAA